MTMNANALVTGIGSSLRGFFEFCEGQNGVKADVMDDLFAQYFGGAAKKAHDSDDAKKAPAKKAHDDSDSDDAKKAPAKKAKPPARKPSGKGKDMKPRDEQTPLPADLNKNKLNELKVYLKERGLPVSGNKAQLIENLLTYEKEQEDAHAPADAAEEEEEDLGIQVKKPKTKGQKLCEPATKKKYTIEERHGHKMVYYSCLDGYFVLDDKNVVVGWVFTDDEADVEIDDRVDIRTLQKEHCEMAKELGLEYEVPDNLDE
jgi:hypothetical protein